MLILMTIIYVLILLTIVYVLVLLSSDSVLLLLTDVFAGALTLIWSILMLECNYKIPVDKGLNH